MVKDGEILHRFREPVPTDSTTSEKAQDAK
jgi:hypothetical protein